MLSKDVKIVGGMIIKDTEPQKHEVVLNYNGEVHKYWETTKSGDYALMCAIRKLEKELGKLPNTLTTYFMNVGNSWEVH